MQLSKLSKNTYHKCIKELHEAKYIFYHPSGSKFQAVRISVIRLDKEEEPPSRYQQLDLFASSSPSEASLPLSGGRFRGGLSLKNETDTVSNVRPSSPNSKTGTVSKLGHIIKPNSKTENSVTNTPSNINGGNGKKEEKKTSPAPVLKLRPAMSEVEAFFTENKYPAEEAQKFFHYNNSKAWMLTDKIPIKNWQSLAHKWMLNPVNESGTTAPVKQSLEAEVNYLYESFLEGNKVFHQITEQHFQQLNLSLTDEIMQQARQQRIKQVEGTNQYSLSQLWQAYLKGNKEDPLLIKDTPTLITLAKRIAVLQHFHTLKTKQQ